MITVQQSYTVCGSNTHTSSGKPPSTFFSEDRCCQITCQNSCMLLLLHAHKGTHIYFLLLQRQPVPTMSLVFLTFKRLQKLFNMRGRREGFGNPAVSESVTFCCLLFFSEVRQYHIVFDTPHKLGSFCVQ